MHLWEEAATIEIFGVSVYRFGFFIALGMIAAAVVIGFLSWAKRCSKGTTPLLLLLSIVLGALFSRLGFCLMNQELGKMMPISSWFNITGGGWSMVGLVGGTMLAAWLAGKITGQKAGITLDIAACAIPVFMALERIGEDCIEEFDYSRALDSGFLNGTFLTFSDEYGATYLATNRLATIVMLVIFVLLMADMIRNKRDGDTCIMFLMFFGACSVILESLRYDRFLSITFVGLQQVLSAVMLLIGILAAAKRNRKKNRGLATAAIVSVFMAAGIGIGLEFALDRTNMNKILIYVIFIVVISVPVVLGMMLRDRRSADNV